MSRKAKKIAMKDARVQYFNIKLQRITGNDARDILIYVRKLAESQANIPGINSIWQRAWNSLVDAADHMDAMIARTIVK